MALQMVDGLSFPDKTERVVIQLNSRRRVVCYGLGGMHIERRLLIGDRVAWVVDDDDMPEFPDDFARAVEIITACADRFGCHLRAISGNDGRSG